MMVCNIQFEVKCRYDRTYTYLVVWADAGFSHHIYDYLERLVNAGLCAAFVTTEFGLVGSVWTCGALGASRLVRRCEGVGCKNRFSARS